MTVLLANKIKTKRERLKAAKIALRKEQEMLKEVPLNTLLDHQVSGQASTGIMWPIYFLFIFLGQIEPDTQIDIEIPDATHSNSIQQNVQFLPKPTTSGRIRKFPRHFNDYLPSLSTSLPHMPQPLPRRVPRPRSPQSTPPLSPTPSIHNRGPTPNLAYTTEPNEFGVYRCYSTRPTYIPHEMFDAVCDDIEPTDDDSVPPDLPNLNKFAPFENSSTFCVIHLCHGRLHSTVNAQELVNVIHAPDFDLEHLDDFNLTRELKRLDAYANIHGLTTDDGWNETSVYVRLPCDNVTHESEDLVPEFEVQGLLYKRITDVIKSAFQGKKAQHFHLTPFATYWRPQDDVEPIRLVGELYTTDTFIQEHDMIRTRSRCHIRASPDPSYVI
jgi:hypothetical protein